MPNWQRGMMRAMRITNHPVTVSAIDDFTPWYRRITFSAPDLLADLEFFPTLWLRIWVEDPSKGGDVSQRGYTLTDVRPQQGTFALDFVLHEAAGPAGDWAKSATVGQEREVALTPKRVELPADTSSLMLVGDVTALPAINSWVEALGHRLPIEVALEDSHPDHDDLPRAGGAASWTVLQRSGARGAALAGWLSERKDSAGLYVWGAGERALVKTIRPVLKGHLGLDRARQFTQFYWIEGKGFG